MQAEGADSADHIVELPVDGVLDLHAFRPAEVRSLVDEYLTACRDRGILEVRLIHGKGTGTLRRIVHSVLQARPDVADHRLAGDASGWGATLVTLHPTQLATPPADA